jgi:hypothetical protein
MWGVLVSFRECCVLAICAWHGTHIACGQRAAILFGRVVKGVFGVEQTDQKETKLTEVR